MKRKMSVIICIFMFVSAFGFIAIAAETNVDDFLLARGVPQEVIDILPENQKALIYESLEPTATFASYNAEYFTSQTEDEVMTAEEVEVSLMRGNIPSADLTLSVVAFDFIPGEVHVYPSFVWNEPTMVDNDSFAMALYPNWDVIPGEENFRLHWKNLIGENSGFKDIPPIDAASNGYTYWMDHGSDSVFNIYFHEGHASIWAYQMNPSATRAITLKYIQDNSPFFNVSYSVNIGIYGSISVGSNSNLI